MTTEPCMIFSETSYPKKEEELIPYDSSNPSGTTFASFVEDHFHVEVKGPQEVTIEFIKHNQGKAPLSQIMRFPKTVEDISRVLDYGAKKYSQDNWKKCENYKEVYLDAALRHLLAAMNGEVFDESTLRHIAHAITSLMFINELDHDLKS